MRALLAALVLLVPASAFAASVDDAQALARTKPQVLIVDQGLSPARRGAILRPVRAFYGFWENGSPRLLAQALAPSFTDHALPPGRPQGPTGPAVASKAFLAAAPDLEVAVTQQLVVGDRVVSHLRFTGHFTGQFMGKAGQGQAVDFIATDIVRVQDGRITDNWHLEDNLTFLRQVGVIAP